MQSPGEPFDLLAIGRVGVDLYPASGELGKPLARVELFARSLGGSPANVSVAAARYGLRSALVTKTGRDAFGEYVRGALRDFGVDDRYVGTDARWPTPVVFAEVPAPDRYDVHSYRTPTAPDLQVGVDDLDLDAVSTAKILWLSGTGLCQEPSRTAHLEAAHARSSAPEHGSTTVLDLDYRARFWPSSLSARAAYAELLPRVSIAIGTLEEVEVAVGYRDPDEAAFALLESGVRLAVVKLGADGLLARDRRSRVRIPAVPMPAINGLGAGDAFGGALCLGLVQGWPLERTLRFAAAAQAIVASRVACADAMPTFEETDARMVWAAGREGLGSYPL